MLDNRIEAAIFQHAEREYPREACGLVVNVEGQAQFLPCRNQATGTDHFVLHPEDYAAAESRGEIVAVVHSHPNASPAPSQADRVSCEASGLPWVIVGWPGKGTHYLQPTGYQAPLLGRVFAHGVLDCYSIVRDWYRQERGVALPDFERADNWWQQGGNLYLENFEKAGFRRVADDVPQPGDVLLMQILANVANHAAIYLGDGVILHHLHGRLSCREVWQGYYKKHTTVILRHGDQT